MTTAPLLRQSLWAALFFVLLIIWVRPGPVTLYGVDAGCYARIAAELAARPLAQWADIRLGGAPFYEHPPGFMWLEAAAFRVGGESAGTAAALARMLATCAALLMAWIAQEVAGERAALGTLLALPAMSSFLFESQNPMLEMPLCVGLLLAMLGAWILPRRPAWGAALFALGSTGACWAKGAPALAAGAWLVWTSWRQQSPRRHVAAAAALAVGLFAASVSLFEWQRARLGLEPFFPTYLQHQVWASVLHGRHNPQASPWYYLPVIWRWHATGVVLAVPVCALLVRRGAHHPGAARLAEMGAMWGIVWLLGFSVMRQKYQWYMHPMTPAFVWIIGAGAAAFRLESERWHKRGLALQLALPGVYGALLLFYPGPLRTPHRELDAIHTLPRPVFANDEARLVAYCAPVRWREQHVARFLWRAELAGCTEAAPYRFDGVRLARASRFW